MDIKLYGAILSPYVRKARIVLDAKAIEYAHDKTISPMDMPDNYADIHPQKRIPAMVVTDDGVETVIADSSAICAFAEKLKPAPAFYPEDPLNYGRAIWLEEYGDTEIGPGLTLPFFRGVFFKLVMGDQPNWEMVQKGFAGMKDILTYLEKQLGDNDWMVGDALSIADISMGVHFVNVYHAGFSLEPEDSEKIYAYINKLMALPMMVDIVANEEMVLEKIKYKKPDLNAWRREHKL